MRKQALTGFLLLAAVISQTGCVVPIYSSSPDLRARELINVSEGYRQAVETWERIWFLDLPDLMTPYRTHGGVI